MKQYIIYRVINLINRKIYIGRTTAELKKRWSVHKAHAKYNKKYKKAGESYLHRSMRKYGVENFEIKEIDRAKDFMHMVWLEYFYIRYYQSTNTRYGYNLIIDKYGEGREFYSEESKLKACISAHVSDGPCGVGWDSFRNKWYMKMRFMNESISKRFNTEEEAKIAKDRLSIFFYKENAQLFFPERRQQYINEDVSAFYAKMKYRRPKGNKYIGVRPERGGNRYIVVVKRPGAKDTYVGCYKDEEEAVKVYDQVAFFLGKRVNFPEKICPEDAAEGEKIYNLYTNPTRQQIRQKPKTSKYNGVNRRSKNTWEMTLKVSNHERVREIYLSEENAALAHDYYVRKLGGNLNRLNYPDRVIEEKPEDYIPPTRKRGVSDQSLESLLASSEPMFPPK